MSMLKTEYRQIYHVKTGTNWQVIPFPGPRIKLTKEEAENKNGQFDEKGVRFVPQNSFEKFLANSRLLN